MAFPGTSGNLEQLGTWNSWEPGTAGNLEQRRLGNQQSVFACLHLSRRKPGSHSKGSGKQTETGTLAILQCQACSSVPSNFLPGPAGSNVGFIPPATSVFMDILVYTGQETYLKQTCKTPGLAGEQRRGREWKILPESCVKHE